MGAGMSGGGATRTVTIENENQFGLVNLSQDVVDRLKGQLKAQQTKDRNEQQNIQNQSTITPQQTPSKMSASDISSGVVPNAYGHSTHHQASVPAMQFGVPTMTALEVRKQKEVELHNNDLYWNKRLADQELANKRTNAILEKEYSNAIEDVKSHFQHTTTSYQKPQCKEFRTKLIECYKRNQSQTLLCVNEVQQFTHCINAFRAKTLDDKHLDASNNKVNSPNATAIPVAVK